MPFYRPKAAVIEARLLTRENFYAVGEWAGADECWELEAPLPEIRTRTPQGLVRFHLGDYVVKGVKGEFYPCPAGTFEASHEPAGEASMGVSGMVIREPEDVATMASKLNFRGDAR